MNKERLSSVRREGAVKMTLWNGNFADSRASVRPRQSQQMNCIDREGGLDKDNFGYFKVSSPAPSIQIATPMRR